MLDDLDKALLNEVGVKAVGDVLAILKHIKTTSHERVRWSFLSGITQHSSGMFAEASNCT